MTIGNMLRNDASCPAGPIRNLHVLELVLRHLFEVASLASQHGVHILALQAQFSSLGLAFYNKDLDKGQQPLN